VRANGFWQAGNIKDDKCESINCRVGLIGSTTPAGGYNNCTPAVAGKVTFFGKAF
jgi:hypothetical protein